jgi:putative ABC transport system permease protein
VTALRQTAATLSHRPARAILTALGTAIGVATIVALLAVADGAKRTAGQLVHLGRADLGLFQSDAADPTTSVLPTTLLRPLRQAPGVADATPLALLIEDIPKAPSAVVFGAEPGSFLTRQMVFSAGHSAHRPREVVVGDTLAAQLHVRPGSVLEIAHRPFAVTGIYHLGVAYQDGGAFISLADAQSLTGHPGEATSIVVRLDPGTHASDARRTITTHFPGILVISNADEAVRAGANGQLVTKATLVIAVLALVIGGIGVMNTMLMSVMERRTEFALLSAVGWSGPQVAGLVLTEGLALSLLGAMAGLVIGAVGAGLLVDALGAGAFVSPDLTAWDFGRALLVGILIGVLGGVYPAWRAARLSPAYVLAQR